MKKNIKNANAIARKQELALRRAINNRLEFTKEDKPKKKEIRKRQKNISYNRKTTYN